MHEFLFLSTDAQHEPNV